MTQRIGLAERLTISNEGPASTPAARPAPDKVPGEIAAGTVTGTKVVTGTGAVTGAGARPFDGLRGLKAPIEVWRYASGFELGAYQGIEVGRGVVVYVFDRGLIKHSGKGADGCGKLRGCFEVGVATPSGFVTLKEPVISAALDHGLMRLREVDSGLGQTAYQFSNGTLVTSRTPEGDERVEDVKVRFRP